MVEGPGVGEGMVVEEPSERPWVVEGPGVEDGVVVEEPKVAATVTKEYHDLLITHYNYTKIK